MRLHDFFDYHCRERPEAEFAIFGTRRLDYGEAARSTHRTANALVAAGLTPGDRVAFLAKNYIQDRVKDMIVSGGENIYPREVEEVLFSHPALADAAVIGVPDEIFGEAVKAVVVLREGATATAEAIMEYCRDRLAGYKRPRSVDFVEVLPRNPSGKVLKRELRDPYWEGRARRVSGS